MQIQADELHRNREGREKEERKRNGRKQTGATKPAARSGFDTRICRSLSWHENHGTVRWRGEGRRGWNDCAVSTSNQCLCVRHARNPITLTVFYSLLRTKIFYFRSFVYTIDVKRNRERAFKQFAKSCRVITLNSLSCHWKMRVYFKNQILRDDARKFEEFERMYYSGVSNEDK